MWLNWCHLFQHLFSAIRAKGGFTDHPTVQQASGAIRILATNEFLRRGFSNHTNVEADEAASSTLTLPDHSGEVRALVGPMDEEEEVSRNSSESESSLETDDSPLPIDITGYTEKDTISYVLGSIIHRTNCTECKALLTSDEMAGGFTSDMSYENANLLYPTSTVIRHFSRRLKPIYSFFEEHFQQDNIVKSAAMKFHLKRDFPSCSVSHRQLVMTFYCRMLIRIFVKSKNNQLKPKDDRKGSRKMQKLNV